MPASSRLILRVKYRTVLLLEKEREELTLTLYDALKRYKKSYADGRVLDGGQVLDLLMTQPHVGEALGITIIAECGLEIERRFGRRDDKYSPVRMSSYAGLNPGKQYSADKQTSQRKGIVGNKRLRTIAIQAGQSALKSTMSQAEDPVGYWAKQLAARNGGQHKSQAYNSAAAAAARRIMEASYWIICKGEPYNPRQYDFDRVKTTKNTHVTYVLRKVEDMQQTLKTHDLEEGVKNRVNSIISTLKQVIGDENVYRLSTFARDQQISAQRFGTRVTTLLKKHGIEHYSQLWFLIQQNTLKDLKGLGEKTYATIIQGLLEEQFLVPGQ
jgi:hypothetical protein